MTPSLQRLRFHWTFLAAAALVPVIELLLPEGWRVGELLRPIFIMAILGLGLNILTGFTGILNLGVAAFMAVGAYTYAILTCDIYPFQLGFWSATGLTILMGLTVGLLLGLPTIRLRGDYLAIVTLGFGEIVQDVLKNADTITKGTQGINPLPAPTFFGYVFRAEHYRPWYYLFLAFLAVVVLLNRNLQRSRIGRAWISIREDELAAACMGINTMKTKLLAFSLGAAQCSLAGALWASFLGSTGEPGNYDFQVSIIALCIVIVGGMGNIGGVLLGALVVMGFNSILLVRLTDFLKAHGLISSSNVFTAPGNWKFMLFGLALILMMRFKPEGLLPSRQVKAELHPLELHTPPRLMSLLDVNNLTMRFGGLTAVNALNLGVPAHQIASLIGPNGAGKTTAFNAITGIYEPTAGSIAFNGQEVRRPFGWKTATALGIVAVCVAMGLTLAANIEPLWATAINAHYEYRQEFPWVEAYRSVTAYFAENFAFRFVFPFTVGAIIGGAGAFAVWQRSRRAPEIAARAGIARTFQNIRLFNQMTVLDNVLLGMDTQLQTRLWHAAFRLPLFWRERRDATERAVEILRFVGLENETNQLAENLSYGHQRRLEIARALAMKPHLLLLDEPAAGMNPAESRALMALIEDIRKRGVTVLLIEHDMQVVMGISDRITVLDHGEKIAEGTPPEVRCNPRVIEAYLGKSNAEA